MSRQTIALDIDDVLASSTEAIRRFVNEWFNVSLEPHHYQVKGPYWGYYETVWANHDIDGDGIIDSFHQQHALDQSAIEPVSGAVTALEFLSKSYRLVAVSSRETNQQAGTERWLSEKFGEVFDAVLCLDTHHNKVTKGEVCQNLGVDYLIDDNIDHCISAFEHGLQPILFGRYGWQDEELIRTEFIRCPDWTAVVEFFSDTTDSGFRDRVEALVAQIPQGRVMTYGQIAALCGNARAARIVGGIAHFGDPALPWQRVVNKSGGLAAGYPGGRQGHKAHLEAESVEVSDDYKVDVQNLLWWPED